MDLKKQFGARIKELRENTGLSQEQLAEKVNMESRHISRIETGKSFTTIENIEKIASALNVDIDALFCFKHKADSGFIKNEVIKFINEADNKEIELIYKIISAVFNQHIRIKNR